MDTLSSAAIGKQLDAFVDTYREILCTTGRAIPFRRDITMSKVAPYAADLSIVELVNDDEWILRLNGTNHCNRIRGDRTGINVLENLEVGKRSIRRAIVGHLFSLPCGVRSTWHEHFDDGTKIDTMAVSFPAFGKQNEQLVVSCELMIAGADWPRHESGAVLNNVDIGQIDFIDLGFGVPEKAA